MLGTKVTLSVSAWLSEKCKNRCISAIWPFSVPLFESGSAPSSVDHSIHEAASDDLWLKLVIAINVPDIVGTTAVVNMRLQSLDRRSTPSPSNSGSNIQTVSLSVTIPFNKHFWCIRL